MFDIIGKRFWFFLISGGVILIGVIFLAVFGLKPGIEFSSGSMMTVSFEQEVTQSELRQELGRLGYTDAIVQSTEGGNFYIRTAKLSEEEKAGLEDALKARFGNLEEAEFYSVSPMVAIETVHNTAIGIAVAAICMLLYISWAFHRMPNPFRWGTCAIISLVHDVLVVVGVFAILGGIFGWQIDLMFVTGILTVIGYSVNDTIVIFDRIRENLLKSAGADFEVVVNNSLLETMSRSLITGLGTLFVLIALILFVGASIQNLVVALLVGIITGTYSSIGTAAPLLVVWEKGEWGRFLSMVRAKGR